MSDIARIYRRKWVRCALALVALGFVGAQFIRPRFNNPPLNADLTMSDPVKSIFKGHCYDCHSNETKLSWFDRITPANWLVAADIENARQALNFSGWDYLSKDRQRAALFECLNQLEYHEMPLRSYSLLHSATTSIPAAVASLQSYLATLVKAPVEDPAKSAAWLDQYRGWVSGASFPAHTGDAPNGVAYVADTRQWGLISFSEHLDDDRTRVVLGNKITMDAVRDHQTNPWPDGTVLAKLAWYQVIDSDGLVRQGAFKQIAFMVKDKKKYSSTLGWGFAQWEDGLQLKAHGKSASFATECVNCHKPMRQHDYVFTTPVKVPAKSPDSAQLICTIMDNNKHTMSALYGNNIAVDHARSLSDKKYPPGSKLTLVTWVQEQDAHWFGVIVPGAINRVEKLTIGLEENIPQDRIDFILRQKAAVRP